MSPATAADLDRTMPVELNKVTEAKFDLINKSGISIWRFHDGMHFQKPDFIYRGWMQELGWEEYCVPGPNCHEYKIPETDVRGVSDLLKERLHIKAPRIIGDPILRFPGVGVLVGGGGQALGIRNAMKFMFDKDLDLLIRG
jgi:hypothetical protein